MDQDSDRSSRERLRDFLARLAPGTQALLMRECEQALARGSDAVAALVLDELRPALRGEAANERSRGLEVRRQVFRPLAPFLVDAGGSGPGRIRRPALEAVWEWLAQDALPELTGELQTALAAADGCTPAATAALRDYRRTAGEAIAGLATGRDARLPPRLAVPKVAEDLPAIGAALAAHEALEVFAARLPDSIAALGPAQIGTILAGLDMPALKAPLVLPFALATVAARLAAPWQIVRLAIHVAGSDDVGRVAAVPHGVAVTIALDALSDVVAALRTDVRRGRFDAAAGRLRILHDGVRGLRTELDLRGESAWGRRLAAIRRDIAGVVRPEIESVPGRVRRLLRVRADREIGPAAGLDPADIEQTAALIGLVAVCRGYAGELAVSEAMQGAFTALRQDVERATSALVEQVRNCDVRLRSFRQSQLAVAVRFCAPLFGEDFAALMARAAERAAEPPRSGLRAG